MKLSEVKCYLGTGTQVQCLQDGQIKEFTLSRCILMVQGEFDYKLILRPLSDLTKPCLEGGKIPVVELAKMAKFNIGFKGDWKTNGFMPIAKNGDLTFLICQTLFYGTIEGDKKTHNNQIYNQLELLQKLFEWHFDVFDLISKREAIDINTISK